MKDIDINVELPKAKVFFSKAIEIFSCIQLLAIPSHHEFAIDFATKMRNELSEDHILLLDEIAKFPFHGLELFDFVLAINEHEDMDQFVIQFLNLNPIELVEIFTMKRINRDVIQQILNKELSDSEIEKLLPWSFKESIHEIGTFLFDPINFQSKLASLITFLTKSNLFNEQVDSLSLKYQDSINKYTTQLLSKTPLELGQHIMNKTFKNTFPYKEFLFSPSYFISPHRLRIHNEHTNHVIYDLRRDHLYINQIGSDISDAMKILSDRTRLEILRQLSIAPTYGKMLANSLDLTTATISHHLDLLKSIHLIIEEKRKNIKYFSINKDELDKLFKLIDHYIYNKL